MWYALLSVLGALAGMGGYLLGWKLGTESERELTAERIERDILRRRNALRDRGRTTERRPEHDGQPPSRNSTVRVVSKPPTPGDQPHRTM